MEKLFCPFIKGKCRRDCIFNEDDIEDDEPENCKIFCALDAIGSFELDLYMRHGLFDDFDDLDDMDVITAKEGKI